MSDTTTTTPVKVPGALKMVREFFGFKLAEMKAEWTNGGLSDTEKAAIVSGLADGSYTY